MTGRVARPLAWRILPVNTRSQDGRAGPRRKRSGRTRRCGHPQRGQWSTALRFRSWILSVAPSGPSRACSLVIQY